MRSLHAPTSTTGGAASGHLGQVARGGALGLGGSVLAAAAGFGLAVVVSRGFEAREAGLFFATTSVFAVAVAACLLGVDSGLARFLLRLEAADRHRDVRRTLRIALVPALVVASLVALLGLLAADPVARALGLSGDGGTLLRVVALALPCAVVAEICLSATRALGRIRTTVVVDRVLRAGAQLVAGLTVVALGGSLVVLVAGWAAAYLLSAVVGAVAISRFLATRPGSSSHPASGGRAAAQTVTAAQDESGLARRFWSFTAPRGVAGLAQVAVQKADIVIVAALLGPVEAAVYAVATRFVALGQMANQAVHQVLQPRFTAILVHDDHATLRQVHRVATSWGILLVWPVYLVVGCAPVVYLAVFGYDGVEVADGPVVVVVMAAAMLLAVASGPVDTLLLMAGRSRLSMGNALLALAVDLTLCLLLVPRMGIAGAAVAWAAAVLVRSSLAFAQVAHHLGVTPGVRDQLTVAAWPLACFAVPVATYSLLGGRSLVGWLLVSLACGIGYLGALYLGRARLHLDLLGAALRRRPRPPLPTDPTTTTAPPQESEDPWTLDSSVAR